MTSTPRPDDPIDAVAALAEPTRRALYERVVASTEAVGRDDAALAAGISRELAAFHLDRLVEAGLLETEFRRRSGRTGPGAGRPAKLYRRAARDFTVSLPERQYERAADLMATSLQRLPGGSGIEAAARTARERGTGIGTEARRRAGRRIGRTGGRAALIKVLQSAGYEPDVDADGTVCLRNCPYDALVPEHRDVTCGMNLAWTEGVIDGLRAPGVRAVLAPEPGRCCVLVRAEAG